jgi:hypothetical protein
LVSLRILLVLVVVVVLGRFPDGWCQAILSGQLPFSFQPLFHRRKQQQSTADDENDDDDEDDCR